MKRNFVSHLAAATLGVLSAFAFGTVSAQTYPAKAIRIVVPWPPGGATDASTRMLAQALSTRLGQAVVVENRPGANGQIGADNVAKSPADGYSLFVASAEPLAINPHVYKSLPYDPANDFIGVAPFAINPFCLVARADFPANSVRDVVAAAKKNPGKLTFGSWGVGSTGQIAMEQVKLKAGIDVLHVPFVGEAPAVAALLGGQIDLMPIAVGSAARLGSKVKVFAVTVPERFFILPNTPSLKEEGYPDVNVFNWFGIVAPAKTPAPIVQRLAQEIGAITASDDLRAKFRAIGLDVHPPMGQAEFNKFIAAEIPRWGEVIRAANIRLD